MTLGEKLRQARLDCGLSQSQVAGNQITRNMLSQLENDQASPSVKTLKYLAQTLGVSLSWLLEDEPGHTAASVVAKARELYCSCAFQSCMELLSAGENLTEEGQLLLCRSAVAYGNKSLDAGMLQEGERAAKLAVACKGIYLCEQDRAAVAALLVRCSFVRQNYDRSCMETFLEACSAVESRMQKNLLMAHGHLCSGQWPEAERELQLARAGTVKQNGYYALLRGWLETENRNYSDATTFLKLAEENETAGTFLRMEACRLLERCYREQEDFKKAYHYALRRLNGV